MQYRYSVLGDEEHRKRTCSFASYAIGVDTDAHEVCGYCKTRAWSKRELDCGRHESRTRGMGCMVVSGDLVGGGTKGSVTVWNGTGFLAVRVGGNG